MSATSSVVTESFDGGSWTNGVNPQSTTNLGVTWTAQGILFVTSVHHRSGLQALADLDINDSDDFDGVGADLPLGTAAVGGWVQNYGGFPSNQNDDIIMAAFDGANQLLGQATAQTSAQNSNEFVFIGITTTQNIDHIDFNSTGPMLTDDFSMDDFVFGQVSAVPLPAAISIG